MKQKSSLWKIVPLLAVVVIVIAAVLIFKKPANQEAALYKATAQTQAVVAAQSTGTFGAQSPTIPTSGWPTGNATVSSGTPVLCRITSPASIRILFPNGGETFTAGQTVAVKWESCQFARNAQVIISLEYFASSCGWAAYGITVPNTGSATFTLPTYQPASSTCPIGGPLVSGNHYKFQIVATGYPYPQNTDESDNLFSINTLPVSLNISRNPIDSTDSTAVGSTSAGINGVSLAKIDVSSQNDAINIKKFPVTLTVATSNVPSAAINTVHLYDWNGNQLDAQAVPTGSGSKVITFQNFNITVPANSTKMLMVTADVNPIGGASFPAGTYATLSVTSSNVAAIQAYASNGNLLAGTNQLAGGTIGNKVYFQLSGIVVSSALSPSIVVTPPGGGGGGHSMVTYTIPFSVTAYGQTAYIPAYAQTATLATPTNKIQFCVDATSACEAVGNGIIAYTGNGSLPISGLGNYAIQVGQTYNFNLIATYQPPFAISTRASLLNVPWSLANVGSTGQWNIYNTGFNSNSYKTPIAAAY